MPSFSRTEKTAGYVFNLQGFSNMPLNNVTPVIRLACHTIDSLENLFNFDDPHSMVNQYNQGNIKLHETSKLFQNVMETCLHWQKETEGLFTPFNTSLMHENHKGNIFDPRGILKSFSMKTLSQVMEAFQINDHTVTVWDDVLISSQHALNKDWTVNIRQPLTILGNKTNILSLNFENTLMRASATSNLQDNNNDLWKKPSTLKQKTQDFIETTIISHDIIAADVWSLASIIGGFHTVDLINKLNVKAVKENTPEKIIEGMFVTGDYQYVFTEGFQKYIQN